MIDKPPREKRTVERILWKMIFFLSAAIEKTVHNNKIITLYKDTKSLHLLGGCVSSLTVTRLVLFVTKKEKKEKNLCTTFG